ncbi:MAG: bifunctional 23S rRNA (guanine(2069)-N(7))-methyltransferase RlmK/23S rRNA (guanine(2445)-N(2))-methyltransferase RlmL [Porticoccaceae bacterium]|jgi:23S rRNA (guanine2445-N2)-methyltransferase / 23S rRNA (guanine2069-N7)-methyltransferase|nr:bifunctional 23S rRNA (guanine(2069)-N(7))-methyltransferase RlmK/23S rRNA (guanine(2445)-N(2))-methyltransferase RlmL [Porticoccaceae bacterium]
MQFFLSCARGLEPLVESELKSFGAKEIKPTGAGVWFGDDSGSALEDAYRASLWSRVGSRVLLPLIETEATTDGLYDRSVIFDWSQHLPAGCRMKIDFSGTNGQIRDTRFGALKLKDAIVDWFRDAGLAEPSLDNHDPDIVLSVRLANKAISIALDLTGEGLHRRGYRSRQGIAPLRESLAASLLMRASWPEVSAAQGSLVDPMCGSGTIAIEAVLMATDRAPGLKRQSWGFEKWPRHDEKIWKKLREEAQQRFDVGRESYSGKITGMDIDTRVLKVARDNASAAGIQEFVQFQTSDVRDLSNDSEGSGLVISNPPYGERLGGKERAEALYRDLGQQLRNQFVGWKAGVLAPSADFGRSLGMHSHKHYQVQNGKLDCLFYLFDIEPGVELTTNTVKTPSEGAKMVAARIRKNRARLKSWLNRSGVENYRVYDADIPEYSAAVDIYTVRDPNEDLKQIFVIQEYAAPAEIEEGKAKHRFNELCTGVQLAFDCDEDQLIRKTRQRQKGSAQYERSDEGSSIEHRVYEGPVQLLVNFEGYLDTGLFLDHRPIRKWIGEQAKDKKFLNLFCYTAVPSLHAIRGGASESLSLDMSNTYLDWARRNYRLNDADVWKHQTKRADCIAWLKQDVGEEGLFDLILLDPPTFSNSKKMEGTLDIQRDQLELIDGAMKRLAPGGVLIFSNNLRRFKLDPAVSEKYQIEDFTTASLDPDFQRNSRIHQCYLIRHSD